MHQPEPEAASSPSSAMEKLKTIIWNLIQLTSGSLLFSVAVNAILVPHHFVSGGITGIALGIHYFLPTIAVGWIYFLLNIPIFAAAWAFVGRRFFIYSIIGMIIMSVTLRWVNIPLEIQDKTLAAIFAGILAGAGSGLILRSQGSAGGTDIISVILLNRFSISVGKTTLSLNVVILVVAAVMLSLDLALHSLIFIYVTARMVDLVLTGLSKRKVLVIVSDKSQHILDALLHRIHRGVTVIEGRGGYTGQGRQLLYTVITIRDLSQVKAIVREIDPHAFVVIQDTLEVMGLHIGNQPHW
jgi:uncharacterized membrane-anchored protein YitT (DUF2179 family)